MKWILVLIFLPVLMAYRNIILIGMPDSGKTYLGRHLSQFLKVPFYDSDIHNPHFKEIKNNTTSWNRFRKKESEIINSWMDKEESKIISTGGGCIENHVLYHKLLNRSKKDCIIHVLRRNTNANTQTIKNLPKSTPELWKKRSKWYFLVSDYNYWNIYDYSTFLDWFLSLDDTL